MEGATGVTGIDDVMEDKSAYERFRKLLTKDVNAAVEGAIKGGATQVIINEAHGFKRNILIEELHEQAEMITGPTRFLCMMEGIDETFAAAFFIGYHARVGTQAAVLNHTISGSQIYNLRLNGNEIGELGLNILVAGYYDVPVILVSGDDKVCAEAKSFLKDVEVAQVKEGIDRYVAKCLTPAKTTKVIRDSAEKALKNLERFKTIKIKERIQIEINFMDTSMAASAALIPTVNRLNSRTVSFSTENIVQAYKLILNCVFLAVRTPKR